MKWLIGVIAAACIGCAASTNPTDKYLAMHSHAAAITPAVYVPPSPAPDGKTTCDSCGGSGKVGDGRIMVECQACGGSGYTSDEVPHASPVDTTTPTSVVEVEAASPATQYRTVWQQQCSGGSCSWVQVQVPIAAGQAAMTTRQSTMFRGGPVRRLIRGGPIRRLLFRGCR